MEDDANKMPDARKSPVEGTNDVEGKRPHAAFGEEGQDEFETGGKLPVESTDVVRDGMINSKNGDEQTSSPPLPGSSENATFDHRRCRNLSDMRYLLRQELTGEEISENTVMDIVRSHPKTCKSRYLFPYPTKKRRIVELYPLSRICCLNPSLSLVRIVHETYPEAILGKDEDGRLPLHYACRFDASTDIVDYLTQQYNDAVRIPTKDGVLPLHYACRNQAVDVIHNLISLYPKSVKISNKLSWLPLHFACCGGRRQKGPTHSNMIISYLISLYPAACKAKTNSGALPLHYAVGRASFAAVKSLVSIYPDGCQVRNMSQNLPLHHACFKRASLGVINLLVQLYPESVACMSDKGSTPLQIVTENGSPKDFTLYLARVESALPTLTSLPFDARCMILNDMMSEVRREAQDQANPLPIDDKASSTHVVSEGTEVDAGENIDSPVEQEHPEQQGNMATHSQTVAPAPIVPGAVRIRGFDASTDDEDDDVTFTGQDASSTTEELIVASEIAPQVTELEAELEVYRRRFEEEVVPADEVVAVPSDVGSKCCIIL